ncbi:MAG TPA: exonuclease domain-containing protein [Gaiellaceae bacterium]|nr:exonuclease domain-containing protein [Gaiellaceae bacterium]
MQLRLDAADRLVELVEERRGPVLAEEAARRLFALRSAPVALARSLLTDVVETDARLAWNGDAVALAAPLGADLLLERAAYVVVDLETTGLRPGTSQICEIGAVRVRGLELEEEFQTLVNPGMPLGAGVSELTGLSNRQLRGAPPPPVAVRRFLAFAGDAVLVAHNARFDLAFLDRETVRMTGSRLAAPVVDTVALARRLLAGRVPRASLAHLAHWAGTSVEPCHRALPDAQATAEVLLALIGLAQERGARTVADLVALQATRTRRVWDKRRLAFGAPQRPGVYLFRDRNDQVLYVGCARDLRARLRSYFRSETLRPAVEAAVGATERIEWRVLGSELEAALVEQRLIRELRPPANARVSRPDRHVWLRKRGDGVVASSQPTAVGPIRSRRRAQLAARALVADELERPAAALPRLRRRLASLAEARRFEDAARLRDRIAALEDVCRELDRLERLRTLERCLLVPAAEPGHVRAFFLAGGRVAAERSLPPGGGAHLEVEAGLAAARRPGDLDVDELLLVARFLRRPPPELTVVSLDTEAILAAMRRFASWHRDTSPSNSSETRSQLSIPAA